MQGELGRISLECLHLRILLRLCRRRIYLDALVVLAL